jgi:hypothetical protein
MKKIFLFAICCSVFWLLTNFMPFRWSSRFLEADHSHIYNHCFFVTFLVFGLIVPIRSCQTIGRSILWGATTGVVSSVVAILIVALTRGPKILALPLSDWLKTGTTWLLMSVVMGAPLIGVGITLLYFTTQRNFIGDPVQHKP